MVSAQHTNITPAKLEEFESTFKHFDKDDTNVSHLQSKADPRLLFCGKCTLLWQVWVSCTRYVSADRPR